jgi:DNA mismatch repair protein MutS2
MRLYPDSADTQLEFNVIRQLLKDRCNTEYSKHKADNLRVHTLREYIELELLQTYEYKLLLQNGQYFPNDFPFNISKEIKLLSVPGAALGGDQFLLIRKLAENAGNIFKWFDKEKRTAYSSLVKVIEHSHYEKLIVEFIDAVIDEKGYVKDNASKALQSIRIELQTKRILSRRIFDKVLARLAKAGYTAQIDESFSNGRKVVAVFAEYKRMVKGILHGESDSRKTVFIEPEETIEINNIITSLENDEHREVQKVLRELTAKLQPHSKLLHNYLEIAGEYDFIKAKAKLAVDVNGELPELLNSATVDLVKAYHPLLYLYNSVSNKKTVPVNILLDAENRILVISGPNAGGKTVTMKTIGLNQLMLQSGLLIPVHSSSRIGIFKQLFIHIGDTQSIEFELSTYSSHLLHMKHFIENANGKTLFFIDELGSGSDPNLGGAFAEVIMEELARKHAIGVVTTHYLNLKIMANHVKGIINGAMAFDDKKLLPLYQLIIGKPGSSYTFSIAERIGLSPQLINRARKLVDENHFKLENLLNSAEQNLQIIQKEKKELAILLKENEKLKKEMQIVTDKEAHRQRIETIKHQNQISGERLTYLKEMERKLKQIAYDYKKAENKNDVIKTLHNLLFNKNEAVVVNKLSKKVESKFKEISTEIKAGSLVKLKKNYQVGEVIEIRGKKAIVQIGQLPMHVDLKDLVSVEKIAEKS